MDEPVARRLRSRVGPGTAATNASRRAFGDASNRAGHKSDIEQTTKRTTRASRSAAGEVDPADEEGPKPKRGRSNSKGPVEKAITKPKPRRSSSRLRNISSTVDETIGKKPTKAKAAKRSSKKAAETDSKPTTTRTAKRAKKEVAPKKPKVQAVRRSTRLSEGSKSKAIIVKETPIIEANSPRLFVPSGFCLSRDSDGEDFTNGIAHYDVVGRDDPLLCKDYVTDMFQNIYEAETRTRPHPYMHQQEDINAKMRAILVDWLVEVHMKFRLNPNTLYLCVNIIDRYCSKEDVKRSKLQLVGVSALLLACKHEEIYPPEVRDCVYITDRAYTREEVLDMEQSILKVLNWKISVPTAYPFLHRFLSLLHVSTHCEHAAQYYLEKTLQEHSMLDYRPSEICCAAVILAVNNPDIMLLDEDYGRFLPGVPDILLEYTGFDKDDLLEICETIAGLVANECVTASKRRLTAVKKKFDSPKYLRIASEADLPSITHVLNRR